jgi:hypothetical protein
MQVVKWLNQNQGFVMAILTFVYVTATITIRATHEAFRFFDFVGSNSKRLFTSCTPAIVFIFTYPDS